MKKYLRLFIIALILIIVVVICGFYILQKYNAPYIETTELKTETSLELATSHSATKTVLILVTPHTALNKQQLLQLTNQGEAKIAQLIFTNNDCLKQQQSIDQAIAYLKSIDVIAGMAETSSLPFNWLQANPQDKVQALSVGFSIKDAHCPINASIPLTKGHWLVVWNDNPDDQTTEFIAKQNNTQTLIGNYDNSLTELLTLQIDRLLLGDHQHLPLIEIHNDNTTQKTAIIFYSGDGGWRDLDRDVAKELAAQGYPVIGVDTLRYYWQRKEPSRAAADLAHIMDTYKKQWGIKQFVLIGFSFGADVLPALYNRLPPSEQQQITAIQLLAFSKGVNYEIKVAGWVTETQTEVLTGPEVAKIPKQKLLCIIGKEELPTSGCPLPSMKGTLLVLPGGHHFDENYPALAKRLIQSFNLS